MLEEVARVRHGWHADNEKSHPQTISDHQMRHILCAGLPAAGVNGLF